MKEIIKNHYKSIILVLGYTIAGIIIYGYLFNKLYNNIGITLLVIGLITIIGSLCGIFYIKSEINAQKKANLVEKN